MTTTNSAYQSVGLIERLKGSIVGTWRTSFRSPRVGARYERSLFPTGKIALSFLFVITLTIVVLFVFFDASITRWVYSKWPVNGETHSVFLIITKLGQSSWILTLSGTIAVGLSLMMMSDFTFTRRGWWRGVQADATFMFWSVAISGKIASLMKHIIGRARPRHLEEYGPHSFDVGAFSSSFASFPSGHSATFGALFMALYLLFPRYGVLFFIAATIGGASRVIVRAHYASDVVAGLCFGALFTLVVARWLAQRGTLFDFTPGPCPKRKKRAG